MLNIKGICGKIKTASEKTLQSKKGRAALAIVACAAAVSALAVSATNNANSKSKIIPFRSQTASTIPTYIEKVQPYSAPSAVDSTTSTASSSSADEASSVPTPTPSSAAQNSHASSALKPSTSTQTHYVVAEPSTSHPDTPSSQSSTSSHIANYKGINENRTYTDQITGLPEQIEFEGVGAGYQETALAAVDFVTTPALGAAHKGVGTATLSGPVNQTDTAVVVGGTGECDSFPLENLTPGTYTAKLTAGDGTVVAQVQFTVKPGGLI